MAAGADYGLFLQQISGTQPTAILVPPSTRLESLEPKSEANLRFLRVSRESLISAVWGSWHFVGAVRYLVPKSDSGNFTVTMEIIRVKSAITWGGRRTSFDSE